MGLFSSKPKNQIPPFPKLPELSFVLSGKEYWLGMSVAESCLKFQKEKDAKKILKGNKHTSYPVVWMEDIYGNKFRVGFINRGVEPIEYRHADIAFIVLPLEDGDIKRSHIQFFEQIPGTSSLEDFFQAFKRHSDFHCTEVEDCCYIFDNKISDVSFSVNEYDELVEVQYNSYW